ncbi:hypothetical protein AXG93_1200s1270 [Marchantia polymorpha subsp. ruderalis]|uniref:EF-hand domain-containing protein n=1 Tax=Marchantia polymorpha subsp. ruderalis TaxID=1480154 RepID=A0A176WLK5_MARPO|nr:hypothetical protein AXG93_1200s1270 [Marchantia polymorpha subsp. ruderalis]
MAEPAAAPTPPEGRGGAVHFDSLLSSWRVDIGHVQFAVAAGGADCSRGRGYESTWLNGMWWCAAVPNSRLAVLEPALDRRKEGRKQGKQGSGSRLCMRPAILDIAGEAECFRSRDRCAYFGIHGALGNRLFDVVTQMRKDQCMYFEDLVIAKAKYEKGGPSEIEEFEFQLLDLTGDGKIQRTEVEAVIISVLATVLGPSDAVVDAGLPEEVLRAFLNAADFSLQPESEGEEPCMTSQDFRNWLEMIPSIKKFLSSLLKAPHADEVIVGRQVPTLLVPEGSEHSTLLRKEYAWHIAGPLQQQESQEWVLLYHSSVNGLSFNTFLGNISALQITSQRAYLTVHYCNLHLDILVVLEKFRPVFSPIWSYKNQWQGALLKVP